MLLGLAHLEVEVGTRWGSEAREDTEGDFSESETVEASGHPAVCMGPQLGPDAGSGASSLKQLLTLMAEEARDHSHEQNLLFLCK